MHEDDRRIDEANAAFAEALETTEAHWGTYHECRCDCPCCDLVWCEKGDSEYRDCMAHLCTRCGAGVHSEERRVL